MSNHKKRVIRTHDVMKHAFRVILVLFGFNCVTSQSLAHFFGGNNTVKSARRLGQKNGDFKKLLKSKLMDANTEGGRIEALSGALETLERDAKNFKPSSKVRRIELWRCWVSG